MRLPRLTLFTLLLGTSAGCEAAQELLDDLVGERDPGAVYMGTGLLGGDDGDEAVPDVGGGTETELSVGPLVRAERKFPFIAKGGSNMGFRLETQSSQFALDGAMEVPDWSAPNEGDPRVLRDDDLDTGWRCTASEDVRCAVGVHFPSPANFRAIRMFAAGGTRAAARIKRIRIHTDEGFADALLPNIQGHVYAVVGKDLKTSNLTVEVLETFPSKSDTIEVGELEFFGTEGVARAALEVEPALSFVASSDQPWRRRGKQSYNLAPPYIWLLDDAGAPHRFAAGSALRGAAGDRLLLIERIEGQINCGSPQGTFFLLDQKTRMVSPVGELGGVGSDVFRAADGNGIATGYDGKLATFLHGVFVVGDEHKQRRTPLREDKAKDDYFALWGLEKEPVARGGADLQSAVTSDCAQPSAEALTQLSLAKKDRTPESKPEEWLVCSLGAKHRLYVTDRGPCGKQAELYVVQGEHQLVSEKVHKAAGSHVFLHRLGAERILLEIGSAKDDSSVLRADQSGISELASHASFATRPPAGCRETCNAEFINPREPTYK